MIGANLRELKRQIWLGWLLVIQIVQMRTRRAVLGIFWIVAPLFLFVGAASLIVHQFGISKRLSGDVPYPLFVFTGLVAWQALVDGFHHSFFIARRAASYGRFVHVSRSSIVAAAGIYTAFYSAIKLPMAIVVAIYYERFELLSVTSIVQLGLTYSALICFGIAVGLIIAPLSYILLDFRYLAGYLLRALILTVPVFFVVPPGLFGSLMQMNPLAILVDGSRTAIIGTSDWNTLLGVVPSVAVILLFLLVAMQAYRFILRRAVVLM